MATPTATYGTQVANANATITPTIPAHVADDILVVACTLGTNVAIIAPAGWDEAVPQQGGGQLRTSLWWRRATGSGTTNPGMTRASGTEVMMACAIVISGVRTSGNPWNTTPVIAINATGFVPSHAGFTAAADTLLMMLLSNSRDDPNPSFSAYANATNPLTWTERRDNTSSTGNGVGQGLADAPNVAGGVTGTLSGSCAQLPSGIIVAEFIAAPSTKRSPPLVLAEPVVRRAAHY